ncbi:MAG: hypothetical protein JKY84_14515 [Emcibacteraceae bacterium]|nr:hypothetical protein [Emcibacteraceae bacterium]
MKGLFLFSIFVITYGSLFPFNFQYVSWMEEGRYAFFSSSLSDGKIPDILGNIALFIAFGFAGTELISRSGKPRHYYFYLYIFGITFAITLQFLQIYLSSRVPALYDAAWNYVGIFLGGSLARFMDHKFPNMLEAEDKLALLALALSWIVFLLAPFMFSFNMEIFQENIRIHLDINEYRFANVIFYIAIWITYRKLIEEIKPDNQNILLSLEVAVCVVLFAKMFVYRDSIEPELLPGGIIAIILLRSTIFNKISPYKFAASILVPLMFYNSLYPFEFYENPFKVFMWVPFGELFSDDMLPIVHTVFYKTFAYGAIVWTLYKSFPNARWISIFCVIYAGSIEYFQHLTLFRIGGLTEPLLVIFLCTFIHQVNEKQDVYKDKNVKVN